MLTEQEISRAWRSLFRVHDCTDEVFAKAEELLDELRPESPLRHRLGTELDELRERADQEAQALKNAQDLHKLAKCKLAELIWRSSGAAFCIFSLLRFLISANWALAVTG